MRFRRSISIAVAFALFLPASATAQSADALVAQIAALMQQIQAAQAEIGPAQPTTAATPSVRESSMTIAPTASCPRLTRNLARGAKGDDVLALQRFLGGEGLLASDSQTGFYGALTEAAVQRWQATYKIAMSGTPATTGWGAMGPRTIRMIDLNCSARVSTSSTTAGDPAYRGPDSCPSAPRPATLCPGSWQAVSGASGCTASWQCVVPLGGATSTTSAPNVPSTPIACPINPRPSTQCLGSWHAATDSRGCTSSWQCI